MKVKELIALLQNLNPEVTVRYYNYEFNDFDIETISESTKNGDRYYCIDSE